jgi:hypothetical protein
MKTTTKTKPKTVSKTLPNRTSRPLPKRKAPEKKQEDPDPVHISYGVMEFKRELGKADRGWRIAQLAVNLVPPGSGKSNDERIKEIYQAVRDAQIMLDLCDSCAKSVEPAPETPLEAPTSPPTTPVPVQ